MKRLRLYLPILFCLLIAGCGDDPVQPEPVPSVPREISAGTVTPTSAEIRWQTPAEALIQNPAGKGNSTLALAGYRLSYADTTITGIDKSATSHIVTGLIPNTSYTFSLKALNTAGDESVAATFNLVTPPLPNPAPPTDFRTTTIGFTDVDLAWTASTSASWSDFEGYALSYGDQEIMLASTATSYTVSNLTSATVHSFTLKARTTDGRESEPVSVTATTQDNSFTPSAPHSLKAGGESNTSIRLTWTAPPDVDNPKFAGYELTYVPGGIQTPILISKNLTSYSVTGLTIGTIYTFSLRAYSSDDKRSSEVAVTGSPSRASQVIRLYSSRSSLGSGLDLDGDNGAPRVLSLNDGIDWDLAYDDMDGKPFLGSPGQTLYVNNEYKFPNGDLSKRTYVSSERYIGSNISLTDIGGGALEAGTLEQMQILSNVHQSFGFVIQTQEGNYAKVLVLANGGKVVQGSGDNTYIELQVAYQPAPNVPFAIIPPGKGKVRIQTGATRQVRPSR